MENIQTLRAELTQLQRQRETLSNQHKRLLGRHDGAKESNHATAIISSGAAVAEANAELLSLCAEIEGAVEAFREALEGDFFASNTTAHAGLVAIKAKSNRWQLSSPFFNSRRRPKPQGSKRRSPGSPIRSASARSLLTTFFS
jgi:hypothetical protein